jgi:hypothetical protein
MTNKFLILTVVMIILLVGYGMFPTFNTLFRNTNTTGLDTQFLAITKMVPYFFFGVIALAAYVVWKRGKQ